MSQIIKTSGMPVLRGTWIESDVCHLLGVFGPRARIYNVYSAGDSGEGCEVIEFTTRTSDGAAVPWTARVTFRAGDAVTECTVGW
jgi:hypothetical protein